MAPPKKVLRTTSHAMLPGYVLGRRPGAGKGPVELLSFFDLTSPSFGLASQQQAAAGSATHGFTFSISGRPAAGQIIGIASFPYQMTFTAADPGDSALAGVAATGTPAFLIQTQVSGIWTTFGTITYTGTAGVVGFSPTNPWVLPANQQFRVVAPASQDTTLADISARVQGVSG
jgi:hypothetical protein